MVGGDRAVEVDLDALPTRVAERLRAPRRRRVAVERARPARSSGVYVIVLPYAVATMRCTPTWSVVVSADGCSPGNTSRRASPGSVVERLLGGPACSV